MHKKLCTAEIEIDEDTGVILRIDEVFAKEHLPLGVVHPLRHKETIDKAALNSWWINRSIPASRMGINEALETLGIYNTELLLTKCLGLSLSDHYWVKPAGSDMAWEDVNFFDNEFSDDIGDVLFGSVNRSIDFNYASPDNTSDGNLLKRWKIIDGKRCLLKSGSAPFRQQPFNEVIASHILDRLGIDHIPYTLIFPHIITMQSRHREWRSWQGCRRRPNISAGEGHTALTMRSSTPTALFSTPPAVSFQSWPMPMCPPTGT